jgi:ubiquinone/menaquinone biosynthesis C-methylase UbiE
MDDLRTHDDGATGCAVRTDDGAAGAVVRTDYDDMAARYDAGRAFPLIHYANWRSAVSPYLPPGRTAPVVDVGSGTGIWSQAFARWFGVDVVGVEPSGAMRERAIRRRPHRRVAYLGGAADAIPLADERCGAAWLSTVIHHFPDLHAAAVELHRVLRPGAPVLIREGFTGRTSGIPWLRYFPTALPITERFWPTVADVGEAFCPVGFRFETLQPVDQIAAPNLKVYADQIRVRADSTLIQLDASEFDAGMARLERDAAIAPADQPVITTLDLAVLRRDGHDGHDGHDGFVHTDVHHFVARF